ncbi:MAG: sensor histidine kinase [Gemmatimonadales bacterium]
MKVSHRLFIAVVPAVFGVITVAALAYWGEYHRTAPEWFVGFAAASAVGSLIVSWRNTRFIARRIERLAAALPTEDGPRSVLAAVRDVARPRSGADSDEIDTVMTELDRLTQQAAGVEERIERRDREASERVQEYAALLAECAAEVGGQLDQVRLPLHILLDSPFGPLNENQAEMIAAARQAADLAGVELKRLEAIASLDRGALSLRRESVNVADVVRSLRPQIDAEASRRGVAIEWDLAPGLPRIQGDRDRLLEALELLFRHVARHADPAQPIRIAIDRGSEGGVAVTLDHGAASIFGPDVVLAGRVFAAHGGTMVTSDAVTRVALGGAR